MFPSEPILATLLRVHVFVTYCSKNVHRMQVAVWWWWQSIAGNAPYYINGMYARVSSVSATDASLIIPNAPFISAAIWLRSEGVSQDLSEGNMYAYVTNATGEALAVYTLRDVKKRVCDTDNSSFALSYDIEMYPYESKVTPLTVLIEAYSKVRPLLVATSLPCAHMPAQI